MEFGVCFTSPATPALSCAPCPAGQLTVLAGADRVLPLGTHLRKIIRPDESGPAGVRARHDDDLRVRKFHSRIVRCQALVAPTVDSAQEDSCQRFRAEPQFLGDTVNVVYRNHGPHHAREVQDLPSGGRHLRVGHGYVGSAEIDRPVGDSLDTAARSVGLIVDPHAFMRSAIVDKPFFVNRIRKGRAASADPLGCRKRGSRHYHQTREDQ